jgi:hypothetical protein
MSTAPTKRPGLTIPVKGLKVTTLVSPLLLTPDLVPPEGQPAGEVRIDLDVGGKLTVACTLNGKGVRRALKTIAEHGPDNVVVLLQGNLIVGAEPGSFVLDCPGLSATPKASKPEPTSPPPGDPASPRSNVT